MQHACRGAPGADPDLPFPHANAGAAGRKTSLTLHWMRQEFARNLAPVPAGVLGDDDQEGPLDRIAEGDAELASLVHIGDAYARNLEFGSGGDPYVPVIQPFAFSHLGISGNDMTGWEEEMKQVVEKIWPSFLRLRRK